jgi:hypothetical protein
MLTPWMNSSSGRTPLATDSFTSSATILRRNRSDSWNEHLETHLPLRQHHIHMATRQRAHLLQEGYQAFGIRPCPAQEERARDLVGSDHPQISCDTRGICYILLPQIYESHMASN